MSDVLRNRVSVVITKERADGIRPILRWIKAEAPRVKERTEASKILREIEGVKEWKQLLLTKGEAELLKFVYDEFPDRVPVSKQLKML